MINPETTKIIAFADNPIIVSVSIPKAYFVADAVFRMLHVSVKVNAGSEHTFSTVTNNSETNVIDISSAFKPAFNSNPITPAAAMAATSASPYTEDAAFAVVEVYSTYSVAGETGNHKSVISSYFIQCIRGGLSEAERYMLSFDQPSTDEERELLNNEQPKYIIDKLSLLSTKPSGEEVRNLHDNYLCSTVSASTGTYVSDGFSYNKRTTNTYNKSLNAVGSVDIFTRGDGSKKTVYVEKNPNRHEFFFLNSFGVMESCSLVCNESKSVKFSTEEFNQYTTPSFIPKSSKVVRVTKENNQWTMSSGECSREWAEWWVEEFLPSRKHWMKLYKDDGTALFLPVLVKPEDKYTIYDKAKPSIPSVKFTVTAAIKGNWDINKNADKYLTP